jgi:hypothetical protein
MWINAQDARGCIITGSKKRRERRWRSGASASQWSEEAPMRHNLMRHNLLTTVAVALFSVSALALAAHAGETGYGGTFCSHSKVAMVQANPDVTAFDFESWGIQTPDSTFKPWARAESVQVVSRAGISA